MKFIHKDLADGRWFEFSLEEQLANVGADVGRAINWRNKGNQKYSTEAFFRALELLYLTIEDPKNFNRLKELTRLKEALGDYFMGDNKFKSSDTLWDKYFLFFNLLASKKRV